MKKSTIAIIIILVFAMVTVGILSYRFLIIDREPELPDGLTPAVGAPSAKELLELSKKTMTEIGTNYHVDIVHDVDISVAFGEDWASVGAKLPIDVSFVIDTTPNGSHGQYNFDGAVQYGVSVGEGDVMKSEPIVRFGEIYIDSHGDPYFIYSNTDKTNGWTMNERAAIRANNLIGQIDAMDLLDMDKAFRYAVVQKRGEHYVVLVRVSELLKNDKIAQQIFNGIIPSGSAIADEDIDAVFGSAVVEYRFDSQYHFVGIFATDMELDITPIIQKLSESDINSTGINFGDFEALQNAKTSMVLSLSFEFSKFGAISDATIQVPQEVINSVG